jgi:hypothetical protein
MDNITFILSVQARRTVTEQAGKVVTLATSIWEVSVRNSVGKPDTDNFRNFPQFLRVNAGLELHSGHDLFLAKPSQFISHPTIHLDIENPSLYNPQKFNYEFVQNIRAYFDKVELTQCSPLS